MAASADVDGHDDGSPIEPGGGEAWDTESVGRAASRRDGAAAAPARVAAAVGLLALVGIVGDPAPAARPVAVGARIGFDLPSVDPALTAAPAGSPGRVWSATSSSAPQAIGRLVVLVEGRTVSARDLATGVVVWSYDDAGTAPVAMVDPASNVVLVRSDTPGAMRAVGLDASSGELLWERSDEPLTFVDRGALFEAAPAGTRVGRPRTGRTTWSLRQRLVSASADRWIVGTDDWIAGIDPSDGSIGWRIDERGVAWAHRDGDDVAALIIDPGHLTLRVALHGLDAGVGRWTSDTFDLRRGPTDAAVGPETLSVDRDVGRVEVENGDEVISLDLATGRTMWRRAGMGAAPVRVGDRIVGCDGAGVAAATAINVVDRRSGDVIASRPIEHHDCWTDTVGQPGMVLVTTDDRRMYGWSVAGPVVAAVWDLPLRGSVRSVSSVGGSIVAWMSPDRVEVSR